MCSGLADGRIVRIAGGGGGVETVARVPGRPRGLAFLGDDELLVCASGGRLWLGSLTGSTVAPLAL